MDKYGQKRAPESVENAPVSVRSRIAFFEESHFKTSNSPNLSNISIDQSKLKRKREMDEVFATCSPVSVKSVIKKLASPMLEVPEPSTMTMTETRELIMENSSGFMKEKIENICQKYESNFTRPEKRIKAINLPMEEGVIYGSTENTQSSCSNTAESSNFNVQDRQGPIAQIRHVDVPKQIQDAPQSAFIASIDGSGDSVSTSGLSNSQFSEAVSYSQSSEAVISTTPEDQGRRRALTPGNGFHLTRSQVPATRSGKKRQQCETSEL